MTAYPDRKVEIYRRYARLLIIFFFIPVMVVAIGSFFFQPYWGPLTRIGGYMENDYGWNAPQENFEKPLFKILQTPNDYDRYYDVVVVGDSFSYDEKKGWQNYFVKKSGLSVITINHGIGVDKIVTSEMFRLNPPRYLIFESLEQFSLARLEKLKMLSPLEQAPESFQNTAQNEGKQIATIHPRAFGRDQTPPLDTDTFTSLEGRIDELFNYLKKATERRFSNEPTTEELRSLQGSGLEKRVFSVPLRHDAISLFSSKVNDRMLVFELDIAKRTDAAFVKQAAEGAWQMKKSIEANGKTKVMMMIFPDKLTVYAPYLANPAIAPPSIIPPLAKDYPYQVRLDEVFPKAVEAGVQDLYLPNDTHCGYKGYQIAAEQMVEAINSRE